MIEQKELCVLSTLLLHSSGVDVTEAAIKRIADHVGVNIDSYLMEMFTKVTKDSLDRIISNPTAGTVPVQETKQGEAPKEEEKQEEEEDEGSDDFDLF